MATLTGIAWKRAHRCKSGSRVWESRCERFHIHASEECYGVKLFPIYWTARVRTSHGWQKLSQVKHRSRRAAERECEQYERRRNS